MDENIDPNLMTAVKAITLFCAISSVQSEQSIPHPIMMQAFSPIHKLIEELKENNPIVDFEQLETLARTCEIELNEAILAIKNTFLGKEEN